MADLQQEDNLPESAVDEIEEHEEDTAFKVPTEMSTAEIMNKDTEDESLRRYKEMLMGQAAIEPTIRDPDNPSRMIGKTMALVVKDRPDVEVDLTDLETVKNKTFVIKEGCEYKIRIDFWVQREIVAGLQYMQQTFKKGIRVDNSSFMMGNYPPVPDSHTFSTAFMEAPKGMLMRGHYTVKSKFRDDDKNEYVKWQWTFDIKKNWN